MLQLPLAGQVMQRAGARRPIYRSASARCMVGRRAYWDVFGRPETKPRYARGVPETWWHDHDKAAKIDR